MALARRIGGALIVQNAVAHDEGLARPEDAAGLLG
jgi:hypothetical protein